MFFFLQLICLVCSASSALFIIAVVTVWRKNWIQVVSTDVDCSRVTIRWVRMIMSFAHCREALTAL